jgi:hypothetical protein
MGYYPFGSKFFSDLVHYTRSGDFVLNLLREAHTVNELAFALGALAHYAADTQGHSVAVNASVPLQYPKLAKKYGKVVTYADDKTSHLRVEFSFDVSQVARGNYAPQAYHDFIGFQVEKPVLERAFRDTYSIELSDIFGDLDLALARGQRRDTRTDARRLASQKRRTRQGPAGRQQAEVRLQHLPRKLSQRMA